LVIIGVVVAGVYLLGASGRDQQSIVRRYTAEWVSRDYNAMWRQLTPASQRHVSRTEFAAQLSSAWATATVESMKFVRLVSIRDHEATVSIDLRTRVFGSFHENAVIPLSGGGGGTQVVFGTSLLFPGLRPGELLSRRSLLGKRGTLLAANGQVLETGNAPADTLSTVANAIAGTLGPIPASQAMMYAREGYPLDAMVGIDGLEAIFQRRLAGKLGGELLAGTRPLATAIPGNGANVRTTIVPDLEQDAVSAIGGRYGGITVMNPRNGALEAAAGIAFSAVQPPGSTFKIITSAAALQAGLTTPETEYRYDSKISLDGFSIQNAGGESCGGTLTNAFAQSCDTTFAPLGAQLGATKLVAMATKFGFDEPTGITGAVESTISTAAAIGGPVAVGASAIGQGLVQASTLGIADVAATIADKGRRPLPTMLAGAKPRFVRATTPKVAGEVQSMMEAVVQYGTGTSAQIPGVDVAGKTGTAELADTAGKKNDTKETDSWFVAYAPATNPKVVVCALFPNSGYGAATAAPAVKSVIEDALGIS
jgi:peptidoglycan glycosyltransferase